MAGVFPLEVVLVAVMVLEELATALLAGEIAELVGPAEDVGETSADDAAGCSLEDDVTISVRKTFSQLSLK